MPTLLEKSLPQVPASIDRKSINSMDESVIPPQREGQLNFHASAFGSKKDLDGESFLKKTTLHTVGIIPPSTPDEVVEKAIANTLEDPYAKKRSPLERLVVTSGPIAEKIRSRMPNVPVIDEEQLEGLFKNDKMWKKYGAEPNRQNKVGDLLRGAFAIDRMILTANRQINSEFNHVYTETTKITPSAIKAASILNQWPDTLFVVKSQTNRSGDLDEANDLPVWQTLKQLRMSPSNNFIARRGLLDHTPLSTGEIGNELISLVVAAEYAEALEQPLGKVIEAMYPKSPLADRYNELLAEQELRQILGSVLVENGLTRVIDFQPDQYRQLNMLLRKSGHPDDLGQMTPGIYTLIKEGMIDLSAVRKISANLSRTHFPGLKPQSETRKTSGVDDIIKTTLPSDFRPNILGFPTWGRWNTSLPTAVGTVAQKADIDGIAQDSAIIIADGTPDFTDNERAALLRKFFAKDGYVPDMPIYIMTQESQHQLVDEVQRRTGLPKTEIQAVLAGTSCGDNRQKLMVVTGSYIQNSGDHITMGLMDDDLEIHNFYPRATGFSKNGDREITNSQVIVDRDRNGRIHFELAPNGNLNSDFLNIPGKTLSQLRQVFPQMPATSTWNDTMHRKLDEAQHVGVAVFEVNPAGEPLNEAKIWGVSAIKFLKPDYRTVKVAKDFLLHEFPNMELSMESLPSGGNLPFAFQQCDTNVDLAFSAFQVDTDTVNLPIAFLTNRDISLTNPFKTVTTNSRADNEMFPTMLPRVLEKTGKSLAYVTGTDLRVEHHRESSGYRPNMIEQACTSLVDNLYAQAANELLEFNGNFPYLPEDSIEGYSIPVERAKKVFQELQDLANIAAIKTMELSSRNTHSLEEENTLRANLEKYRQVILSLKSKLGVTDYEEKHKTSSSISDWDNVAFDSWKKEIDAVGRNQLHYFRKVMENTPVITQAVHDIISEGKYPISMLQPKNNPHFSVANHPVVATRP